MSPSSNCSCNTPVHPASLADPSTHSLALVELIDQGVTRALIAYVVDKVIEMVHSAVDNPSGYNQCQPAQRSKFLRFATTVIHNAKVEAPTLLVALLYVARAKPWARMTEQQYAYERVLLGALIISHKYTNDGPMKIKHWERCNVGFDKQALGLMEREFLNLLDYRLGVTEAELLDSAPCHMAPSRAKSLSSIPVPSYRRLSASRKPEAGTRYTGQGPQSSLPRRRRAPRST
ncbi:hypothetical protein C8T65DRAFT_806019 [Cerioporus squamosus]|nr:hypothetical protein C8T65DRAFT_806019 [Cerioporus squamosus]